MKKIIPLAILAGICISIGCVVNLRVGGVAGAVLFAFGLTTVVYYGLKLYTGTAGFIRLKGDWVMLGLVLLGNISPMRSLTVSNQPRRFLQVVWRKDLLLVSCWLLVVDLS